MIRHPVEMLSLLRIQRNLRQYLTLQDLHQLVAVSLQWRSDLVEQPGE